jgi:hypothetical protein
MSPRLVKTAHGSRALRLIDWTARPFHLAVSAQLEPRDVWIGCFWRLERWHGAITGSDAKHGAFIARPWSLHVYVCVVPILTLHVYVDRTVRPSHRGRRLSAPTGPDRGAGLERDFECALAHYNNQVRKAAPSRWTRSDSRGRRRDETL